MEIGSFELRCNASFKDSAGERYLFMMRRAIRLLSLPKSQS